MASYHTIDTSIHRYIDTSNTSISWYRYYGSLDPYRPYDTTSDTTIWHMVPQGQHNTTPQRGTERGLQHRNDRREAQWSTVGTERRYTPYYSTGGTIQTRPYYLGHQIHQIPEIWYRQSIQDTTPGIQIPDLDIRPQICRILGRYPGWDTHMDPFCGTLWGGAVWVLPVHPVYPSTVY